MSTQKFYRELARRSKKRVPNMRSMTFADLAKLNESYISRCIDEREAAEKDRVRNRKGWR